MRFIEKLNIKTENYLELKQRGAKKK